MKILILTSKDHLYANYLLRKIIKSRVMDKDTVMVWEQDAIVPGKSRIAGLWRYLKCSGFRYVGLQIIKQFLFLFLRQVAYMRTDRASIYFPYWHTDKKFLQRETYGNLRSDPCYRRVRAYKPDLILSVFSKEIVPERILRIPRFGAVNLHPAYLPEYRGVSPIFWAMAEGARHIGITLHYMDIGIDTGAILSRRKITMKSPDTEHGVYLRAVATGVTLLIDFLNFLHRNHRKKKGIKITRHTGYHSLPTKNGVDALYAHGYAIFRIGEFFAFNKVI